MKAPIGQPARPSATASVKRINSKQKGNSYERWLAKFFREKFGFTFCRTSRQASRLLDDTGIDLSGIPYNISAKSGYRNKRPKPDEILQLMALRLVAHFPPEDPIHNRLSFLFHKLDGHSPFHHLVSMTFDDWVRIMIVYEKFKNYSDEGKIKIGGSA